MAAANNLVLQLLITAKDNASAAFGTLFSFLDRTTSATANLIRQQFTDLFGGGMSGAIEFEAQLDRVAAKGGYTADEVAQLKTAAQQLGAQFGISGTEAAQGMESLAAAGLTAKEAIATLPQVLALAASEQISADAAATKLIDSLSIMGLGFEEAGRMADVLAKGANITTSSASQLAEALSEAGGVAKAAGLDLEVTVAALDLLHKNGIKGSEAGTALKAILTALLDPASKASQELDALGITSRDLGTVMGELQGRGDSASTAILAFGTEAGPGLRALIGEGQTGLLDYTEQLRDAEGAAQQAADEMGGNLKSALATLGSAWESLKSALLEPLLEPITKQVKALGKAFQEGLSSDQFKTVQDTIRQFGEAAAQSIGDFIQAFDFAGALAAVASFAASAKGHFEALSTAGSTAASVVSIAWNGVTAGFKVIGAAMVTVVASIVATLANIEEAASQVGLGSVERANALRAKALEMQATASGLIASVKTDAEQMGAAFDQLTTKADAATTATNALKEAASLPPDAVSLEPLVRTIEDYKAALDRAKVSQAQAAQAASDAEADYLRAGQAMDNGTGSAYRYEQATLANRVAQATLQTETEGLTQASSDYTLALQEAIRGIDGESNAVTASVKTKKDLIKESETAVTSAKKYSDAVEGAAQAQLGAKDAEIALAAAKGETAEVQRLTIERAQLEADLSVKVARAKQAEQEAEVVLAQAQRDQLAVLVSKGQATQQDLALAELVVQKELAEAQAAGVNTQAQEVLAQKLREVNAAKGGATEATGQNTQATAQNTEATAKNNEARDNGVSIQYVMNEALKGATERTRELSAATGVLFEKMFLWLNNKEALTFSSEIEKYRYQLNEVQDEYAEITQKIAEMAAASRQADEDILFAANSVIRYFAYLQKAEADASRAFYEQKLAAEQLADQYEKTAESGVGGFQNVQAALTALNHDATVTVDSLHLLDEEDLSRLQSAIDAANDKLREMQDETQSAKDRLAELNADILEAQGQDQKAEVLRQQLEYQQQLAELEQQRQTAELTGNRELLALLAQQESQLAQLHRLKIANIEADAGEDRATTRLNDLATAAERAGSALRAVGGVDLEAVSTQAERLTKSFSDLNGVL